MKLIAKWKRGIEPAYDEPSTVVWGDGTTATMDDYRAHYLDTHSLHEGDDGGLEKHMFPQIIAQVAFDPFARDWVVKGPDVVTAALELHDPNATDDQIIGELFTFPIVYRAKIVRCPGSVRP